MTIKIMNKRDELLQRAAGLVGNPRTHISASADIACEKWQEDYQFYLDETYVCESCGERKEGEHKAIDDQDNKFCGDCISK